MGTDASQAPMAAHDGAARVTYRTPLMSRLFSLFGVVVLGGVAALVTTFSVFLLIGRQWVLGAAIAPLAVFLAGLTGYVARDLRGKWGLRIDLDPRSLTINLPAGRSLLHHPAGQHTTIAYADIAAVETRLEAYVSLGMAMMQRTYALRPKNGPLIFLFEDRALGTWYQNPTLPAIVAAIAQRIGVPLRDLGMVKGGGGVLALWGTHAPDWTAPSLSTSEQLRLWRHVAITGLLSIIAVIAAVVIRLFSGPL